MYSPDEQMKRLQYNPLPSMLNDDLWRSSDVDLSRFHRKTVYPQPHFPPRPVIPRYTHKLDNCIFTLPPEYRAKEPVYPTPGLRQSRVAYFVQPIDFKLKDIVVRLVGNSKTISMVFPTDLYLTDRAAIYGILDYVDSLNNNFRQPGDYKSNVPDVVCNSQFDGISTVPLTLLPLRLPRLHMDWVITPTAPYWCWTLYTGIGRDDFDPREPDQVLYHHGGAYTNPLCKSMSNVELGHCYLRHLDVTHFRIGTADNQRIRYGKYHGSYPGAWDRDMASDPHDKLAKGFFGKRTTALIQELEHSIDTLSFYSGPIFKQWIDGLCQDFDDDQHADLSSDDSFNTESRYIAQFEEMLKTERVNKHIRIGPVEKELEEQFRKEAKWDYRSQAQDTPISTHPPLSLLDSLSDDQQPDSLEKEIRACSLSDPCRSTKSLPDCASFPSTLALPKGIIKTSTTCSSQNNVFSKKQPSTSKNSLSQELWEATTVKQDTKTPTPSARTVPPSGGNSLSQLDLQQLAPPPPPSDKSKAQQAQDFEEERTNELATALQATQTQENAHAARTSAACYLESLNHTINRSLCETSRSSSPNTTVMSYTHSDHHSSHYTQPEHDFPPTITPDTLLHAAIRAKNAPAVQDAHDPSHRQ